MTARRSSLEARFDFAKRSPEVSKFQGLINTGFNDKTDVITSPESDLHLVPRL